MYHHCKVQLAKGSYPLMLNYLLYGTLLSWLLPHSCIDHALFLIYTIRESFVQNIILLYIFRSQKDKHYADPPNLLVYPQYCYPRINTGYLSYQSMTKVALQSKIPCLLCSPWYHKACLVCLFNTYTTNLSQIICKTTVSLLIELLIL